ncbi:hypothetical protein [Metabacillus sp. FJAT-52054]|uniref:DUF1579 domain-containing protein n=1 Tax=Metabacillus sediminis TaxID=3117746 RepID=A0ABZ2NCR7_9BACI
MADSHNPYEGLKSLEKLVGAWNISGSSISGHVVYSWMEGGYFLVQHFDLVHNGRVIKGMEVIGYTKEFGEETPGKHIKSRMFDNYGNSFEYTYEVNQETLIIWGDEKGSPAYYKGKWSDNGNSNSGQWVYPGGGYESVMSRMKEA